MNHTQHFNDHAAAWDVDPAHIARAAAIATSIRQAIPLRKDMRAFEFGCGTGLLSFALRDDFAHITLADSSEGMLDVLRRKIAEAGMEHFHPVRLDLADDPVPDARFDVIFTSMTLHHVKDVDGILRTFHSMLLSPGHLCIADLDAEDGSFHGEGFDVHHGFDRTQLERQAQAAGFHDVRFTTAHRMTKRNDHGEREYPIFLMTAGKQ